MSVLISSALNMRRLRESRGRRSGKVRGSRGTRFALEMSARQRSFWSKMHGIHAPAAFRRRVDACSLSPRAGTKSMNDTTIGPCTIVTVTRRATAVIKAQTPLHELPQAQRRLRAALSAVLPKLDVGVIGASCTLWHPPSDGRLDMEAGVLVARGFEPEGEVVPSTLPAGRAAHFMLRGPFDGLPKAWQTLFDWCDEQDLELAGINWEIYGDDPAEPQAALYALLK